MKKFLRLCFALVLIVPALFLLSACVIKDPIVPSDPAVYEGFVFEGNKMIGYVGDETEIIIPSSYSIQSTDSDVCTVEYNIKDIINYGDESSLDYEIWAEDITDYDRFILVGGMYNVCINNGEKQYIRIGEAEEFFTQVKKEYTDLSTTITIELTDYTLTPEDKIDESNFTCVTRPFIEMVAGKLESFSYTYNGETVNFTKENYLQQYQKFLAIIQNGLLAGDITYDIGNYIEFVEGEDHQVDTITSLSPDYAFGGGMFAAPPLTKITVSDSIATIEENVFDGITTLADVVIESEAIYTSLTNLNACGDLIEHATKIKVLKSIVDKAENVNAFLNDDANYTRSEDGDYYVYTK